MRAPQPPPPHPHPRPLSDALNPPTHATHPPRADYLQQRLSLTGSERAAEERAAAAEAARAEAEAELERLRVATDAEVAGALATTEAQSRALKTVLSVRAEQFEDAVAAVTAGAGEEASALGGEVARLRAALAREREKRHALERRRKMDLEGFARDVAALRKTVRSLEAQWLGWVEGGLAGAPPDLAGLAPLREAADGLLGDALRAREGSEAWARVEADTVAGAAAAAAAAGRTFSAKPLGRPTLPQFDAAAFFAAELAEPPAPARRAPPPPQQLPPRRGGGGGGGAVRGAVGGGVAAPASAQRRPPFVPPPSLAAAMEATRAFVSPIRGGEGSAATGSHAAAAAAAVAAQPPPPRRSPATGGPRRVPVGSPEAAPLFDPAAAAPAAAAPAGEPLGGGSRPASPAAPAAPPAGAMLEARGRAIDGELQELRGKIADLNARAQRLMQPQ